MAEITAQLVKQIRDKTGSGISLCKDALVACDGNMEEAEMWLRKKDKDKAAKKAERATGEGVVFVKVADDQSLGVLLEIACETDFAAKNEKFQVLGNDLLDCLAAADDLSDVPGLKVGEQTIRERMEESVAVIGENMKLRRVARLAAPDGGCIVAYKHFNNKAASLVALKLDGVAADAEAVGALGRDICMHITSVRPVALNQDSVPANLLAREKEVFLDEVKDKPEQIQEKIIQGKLGKFLAGICLTEQGFVKDDKVPVKKHVEAMLKEAGGSGEIVAFTRVELGSSAACIGGEIVELEG